MNDCFRNTIVLSNKMCIKAYFNINLQETDLHEIRMIRRVMLFIKLCEKNKNLKPSEKRTAPNARLFRINLNGQ